MLIQTLLILAVVIAFIVFIRRPSPVVNKQGIGLNTAPQNVANNPNDKDTFSVATFNIQTGKSLQGKRDINRSATAIKDADLVGVQEVYAPGFLNKIGFGNSQGYSLAKLGGFDWLMCSTRRRYLREHRGNLLLSKLPISNWSTEMLPDYSNEKRFRNMTIAEVVFQGQSFHFINTHLHTHKGSTEQLNILLNEFAKYPRVILVGDFNNKPDTPALKQLLKDNDVSDVIGATAIDSDEQNRIDWILTKGFKIHKSRMVEKGISDHPYYEATLSFNS